MAERKTRKAIRKKIVELLKAGNTKAQDRVYPNYAIPSWEENLPVILVYNRDEEIEKFNQAPRELKRDVQFVMEIIEKGSDNDEDLAPGVDSLSDKLDDLCEQVEAIFDADETLGGTTDDSILTNMQFTYEGEGNRPTASARLTYMVTYVRHTLDNADTLPDLEQTNVDWKVGHHDSAPADDIEAKDEIDLST
jgi:hypothetical protein